jgi:hypothetical protein
MSLSEKKIILKNSSKIKRFQKENIVRGCTLAII